MASVSTSLANKFFLMHNQQSIKLQPVFHRGSERILVLFWHDMDILQVIRSMGARYSNTHSSWYVNYSEQNLSYLKEQLVMHDVIQVERAQDKRHEKVIKQKRMASGATTFICDLNEVQQQELLVFEQYMRGQRYSKSTINSYLTFVRSFLGFYKDKQTAYITLRDIHKYNFEVIIKNSYSVSYQRQFIGALKLFYDYVAHCSFDTEELQRPRKEKTLPTVLSKEEVRQILIYTRNLKHKAILSTIYSGGLRVSEVLNLRISDLDHNRFQLHIRAAKGKKDRYVKLSKANLMIVKSYLQRYTPRYYLFEGPDHKPYSTSSVRNILKTACKKAGIKKRVSPHTLRHSYATHLLELGVDVRYVQTFLGHKKPETTMIYTHISSNKVEEMVNPLDELFKEELISLADKRNKFSSEPPLIPQNDWGY